MKTFRRKSIWRCFNTYLFIIFTPFFCFGSIYMISLIFTHFNSGTYTLGEQMALSAMAFILAPTILMLPLALFNSLKYVVIDEGSIIFKHAITEREKRYRWGDIKSFEVTRSRVSVLIKLNFRTGKSKYVSVNMVTSEQLKSISGILSDKTSKN